MPFLRRAKAVDVIVVATERPKSDELQGADMAEHLARHELEVDLRRIVSGGTDVASTILSYAADAGADFIVMGGYGHSRLREFILGGATRGILSAMTVPTLMSHVPENTRRMTSWRTRRPLRFRRGFSPTLP